MGLDVAGPSGPIGLGAAERGPEAKVRVVLGQGFKLGAIQQSGLVTDAEQEGDGVGFGFVWQSFQYRSEWRDAGAGGYEDGLAAGLLQDEVAQGRAGFHRAARGHLEQEWREEAILHQVQADLKLVPAGGGRDGVGAGDLLARELAREGDKLAGDEGERFHFRNFKHEVPDFGRNLAGFQQAGDQISLPPARFPRDQAARSPEPDGHRAAASR